MYVQSLDGRAELAPGHLCSIIPHGTALTASIRLPPRIEPCLRSLSARPNASVHTAAFQRDAMMTRDGHNLAHSDEQHPGLALRSVRVVK
jgi:hypothetical protein